MIYELVYNLFHFKQFLLLKIKCISLSFGSFCLPSHPSQQFSLPTLWNRRWVQTELLHLDGDVKQIIVALALCLGLLPRVSPDVDAVSADKHGGGPRILLNCFGQTFLEILFERSVFDDWNNEFFVESKMTIELMVEDSLKIKNSQSLVTFTGYAMCIP